MPIPTIPRRVWIGARRDDGVSVSYRPIAAVWAVNRPGQPPVLACPCCGMALQTEHAAQLVADVFYPLTLAGGTQA